MVKVLSNISDVTINDVTTVAFIEDCGLDITAPEDCNLLVPPPSRFIFNILCEADVLPGPCSADSDVKRVLQFLCGKGADLSGLPIAHGRACDFVPLATVDRTNERAAIMAVFVFIAMHDRRKCDALIPLFRFLLAPPRRRSDSL